MSIRWKCTRWYVHGMRKIHEFLVLNPISRPLDALATIKRCRPINHGAESSKYNNLYKISTGRCSNRVSKWVGMHKKNIPHVENVPERTRVESRHRPHPWPSEADFVSHKVVLATKMIPIDSKHRQDLKMRQSVQNIHRKVFNEHTKVKSSCFCDVGPVNDRSKVSRSTI
jgi:hypothetical protein